MPNKKSLRSKDLKQNKNTKTVMKEALIEKADKSVDKIVKVGQIFRGRVVAAKTSHTATVLLESRKTHPLYKKSYARSKKYLVADDLGVKAGDLVEITKCKPISKRKHFRIIKVIGRDMEAIITEKLKEEAQAAIEEVMPAEKEELVVENQESIKEETTKKPKKNKENK